MDSVNPTRHAREGELVGRRARFRLGKRAYRPFVSRRRISIGFWGQADVLALGKQSRRAKLVHIFKPPHRRSMRAITLSAWPISLLHARRFRVSQSPGRSPQVVMG